MIRSLLLRGMLVGLGAGLLAFVFAYLLGEPSIRDAIAIEEKLAAAAGEPPGEELVSRGMQETLGLLTGTVLMGVAIGGLFSLVFAYAYGRISAVGPRVTAGVLALGAFVTISLVPFLKYAPNPPTVGSPDTLDRRTLLFLAMIVISLVAAIAAGRVRRQVLERTGGWTAGMAGAATFVALVIVAYLAMPAGAATPEAFPADLLWQFRLASFGIHAVMWTAIGLGFGAVAERLIAGQPAPAPRAVPVEN